MSEANLSSFKKASLSILRHQLSPIQNYLDDDDITEIAFNGSDSLFVEKKGEWLGVNKEELQLITDSTFLSIGNVLSGDLKIPFGDDIPIFSGSLDLGDKYMRIQITRPPASKKWSLTIRKFAKNDFTLEQLEAFGMFDETSHLYKPDINEILNDVFRSNEEKDIEKTIHDALERGDYIEFFKNCVLAKKNIIISGSTGSGKTTFAKALIHKIPSDERLITIEDAEEIRFQNHENFVQLFFDRNEGSSRTPESMFLSCMRMKPDRVLLSEIRGGEALIYIESVISDHPGSITTLHASSVAQAKNKLIMMIARSGTDIPVDFFKELIDQNINVIVQINKIKNKRSVTGILYQ